MLPSPKAHVWVEREVPKNQVPVGGGSSALKGRPFVARQPQSYMDLKKEVVPFAGSLLALTKNRLLNNRKDISVTSSDEPPSLSHSRPPSRPGPIQYFRCYCIRPRLSFSDSVVMILASGPTGGSRMEKSLLARRGPGKQPQRGPSLCRGTLAVRSSIPRVWGCRKGEHRMLWLPVSSSRRVTFIFCHL